MKYRVTGTVTITVIVDVEAKTPKLARAAAEQASMRHLCHQCAGVVEGEWSTTGELDGEPEVIGVERLR